MKEAIIVLFATVIGICIAEYKVYNITQSTTFGLGSMLDECEKSIPRDKECKLEIKAVVGSE
jgi:hypothetical protein